MTEKLHKLKQKVREIILIDNVCALLGWDQETYMPPQASNERGLQLSLFARLSHQKITSAEYGDLLQELYAVKDTFSLHDQQFLDIKKRSYDLAVLLPEEFVGEMANIVSLAQQAWSKAKNENDFKIFQPHLAKIIDLNKQKAKILNPDGDAYETLLNLFENGLTINKMDNIFATINPTIRQIIAKHKSVRAVELTQKRFNIADQKAFSYYLLDQIGYNFETGNLAEVAHPFMTRLGKKDIRVTNHYSTEHLSSLFSALHEGGHALFEQGFDDDYSDLLNGDERSLGVHESQSRFWENVIGRSEQFWAKHYEKLQEIFDIPDSLETFLEHINYVQPSFIRTESDEVSYNLHIQIRYELEKMLMSGNVDASQVPEVWNQKYQEYLGITPNSDTIGCLQDVHWSHGTLGYFPTYTLGNVISAQFWWAYQAFDADYLQTITSGDYAKILNWFKQKVHQFGPLVPTEDLVKEATGQNINPEFFVKYLTEKYL